MIPISDFYDSAISVVDRDLPQLHSETGTESFWRKEAPILTPERSLLTGGMFVGQREWWDLDNFIRVFVGGYGVGKTTIGCKRIISLALDNAPCPVAAISPSFAVARQTTITTIMELLKGKSTIYGSSFWWRYNSSIHQFTIKFRGRTGMILIYSGDNPLSLRGPNLAAAYIDEPFIQDREVFLQIMARIRHPEARNLELCMTGTPEELNWGYDICVGEEAGNFDVGLVQVHTRENLALNPLYIQRLEDAYDEKTASAYLGGQFVSLGAGLIYHKFDPAVNSVSDEEIMKLHVDAGSIKLPCGKIVPGYATLGVGMDFNVNPMAAAVFWVVRDHIHFFDEIELSNSDTEFMCSTLRERYGTMLNRVYPDATGSARHTSSPAGKSDFSQIRSAGFEIHARSINPKRRDRYNSVNGKLKRGSGRVTMTVSKACKKLHKYLLLCSYEKLKKQKEMTHLLDAASYPVSYLFPVDKQTIAAVQQLRGVY